MVWPNDALVCNLLDFSNYIYGLTMGSKYKLTFEYIIYAISGMINELVRNYKD